MIEYLDLKIETQMINDPREANKFFLIINFQFLILTKKLILNLVNQIKKTAEIILKSIKKSFDFVAQKKALGLLTLPVCKRTLKVQGLHLMDRLNLLVIFPKKNFVTKIKK